MTKIRKDKHGLFIFCGGYCFRPIFEIGYQHLKKQDFLFSENDQVRSNHIRGTKLCKLKKDNHEETWFSHGNYMDNGKKINSEQLFNH